MQDLIAATKRGDIIALKKAIRERADLNERDVQGWTPLFHAAHTGHLAAVKLLLEAGADVNDGVETGFTALFSAVLAGHVEVVRELLRVGAKVAPVQGIELRGHSPSSEIRELLDASLR